MAEYDPPVTILEGNTLTVVFASPFPSVPSGLQAMVRAQVQIMEGTAGQPTPVAGSSPAPSRPGVHLMFRNLPQGGSRPSPPPWGRTSPPGSPRPSRSTWRTWADCSTPRWPSAPAATTAYYLPRRPASPGGSTPGASRPTTGGWPGSIDGVVNIIYSVLNEHPIRAARGPPHHQRARRPEQRDPRGQLLSRLRPGHHPGHQLRGGDQMPKRGKNGRFVKSGAKKKKGRRRRRRR